MALSSLGHGKNHWEPISCACCSLSFISESLRRIRYPLMEGRKGCMSGGAVTFWIQLQEVKSTHYQSGSPQKHIRPCLKLAVAFILSVSQMETQGWRAVCPLRPKAFYRHISSTEGNASPLLTLPTYFHQPDTVYSREFRPLIFLVH